MATISRSAGLERKARLIADMTVSRNNRDSDYALELKIAYAILDALGVKE